MQQTQTLNYEKIWIFDNAIHCDNFLSYICSVFEKKMFIFLSNLHFSDVKCGLAFLGFIFPN